MNRRYSQLVALAAVLAGCGERDPLPGCQDDIAVEVGVDQSFKPLFRWANDCGISSLTVEEVTPDAGDADPLVWGITAPEQDPLGSGIAYGSTPSRATVWHAPEALEAGKQYRVTVTYTVGGDAVAGRGIATFTWFPPD